MRRSGLDPAKLDRVTGQSMSGNTAALRRGESDVVQLFQPFVEELLEEGTGHIWYAAAERGPTSYTTLYARRALLADRRGECERMVRALHRTLKWVHAGDGARLAAAIAAYFPDVPRKHLANALDRYKALGLWGRDTRLPRSGYERLRDGLVSGGLVSKGTSYETAVDNTLAELVARQDPPALMR
jgi:NitT/TauT family transport system substrate-binding protein